MTKKPEVSTGKCFPDVKGWVCVHVHNELCQKALAWPMEYPSSGPPQQLQLY